MRTHKHTRTHSLTFIGHVTRTRTRARTHSHSSVTLCTRAHASLTPSRACITHTHPAARTHKQTPKNMNSHNPRSSYVHKHSRTHCLAHALSMSQKPTFTTTAGHRCFHWPIAYSVHRTRLQVCFEAEGGHFEYKL